MAKLNEIRLTNLPYTINNKFNRNMLSSSGNVTGGAPTSSLQLYVLRTKKKT